MEILQELSQAKGTGTSLVTLYIPPGDKAT